MIRFGAPQYLYALFLVPLTALFMIWSWKRKQKAMEAFAGTELGDKLTEQVSRRRQKIKNVLLLVTLTLILLAMARPQYGFRWEEVKRRGVDVMIAVDLSKSMLAQDVSPDRLERARRKILDFLNIAEGDRLGLIGFAGRAFVLTPLTLDYGAIRLFADQLEPDLVPVPGTAVAEAIELAIKALRKGNPESKGMILMSDGEDMAGDVVAVAKKAGADGVKIYTLGIGTIEGAPIPVPGGGFQKDKGEVVMTKLDEKTMVEIAKATGGKYVRSVSADRDLEEIYRDIQGGLEEHELKESKRKKYIDRFQWFLLAAFILLIIETLMRETRRKKKIRLWRRWFVIAWTIPLFLWPGDLFALGITGTIREGEELYQQGKYDAALEKFLEAQVERPRDMRLKYNIANTYYRLNRYDEAKRLFSSIPEEKMRELRERSLYNRGNSEYRLGKLEEAIKSYENALKIDPNDKDARYNLEFVKKLLEQQKQQQKQQQQNQQKKQQQEQKQDQQKQEQDQKQRQKEEEQQKQEQQKQNQQQEQKGQEQQQKSKQEQQQQKQQQKESEEKKKEQQGKQQTTSNKQLTKEEAQRWLSTIREGKRKAYSKGTRSPGEHKSVKDW